MKLLSVLYLIFFEICFSYSLERDSKISNTIDYIYKALQKTQCKKEQSFRKFPPRLAENKGLYRSYIHINFMDPTNSILAKIARADTKVTDMNMFVTNFVIYSILETFRYEGIEQLDKQSLESALEALLDFKDKNYINSPPIYTFWKQIKINNTWSQHPETMCEIIGNLPRIPNSIINFLNKIGLKNFANSINSFQSLEDGFEYAYRIPPDTDDTSINLALTGLIYNLRDKIGSVSDKWIDNNKDYKFLFKELKYTAYRPFSYGEYDPKFSNSSNLIDSRTYFFIHDFLTEKLKQNSTDIILPTTWIHDIERQQSIYKLELMPFSVNNVDMNVAGNFLFGVTCIVLFHQDHTYITEAFDSDIRNMYMNTIDLLSWAVKTNIINVRQDLTFLYYPSLFDFYWLVSRTYSTLKNFDFKNSQFDDETKQFFIKAENILEELLKNEVTDQIMSKIMKKKDGTAYFLEFLGNYANVTRGEDTMFATGLAINSLINIWTTDVVNSTTGKVLRIDYDENEIKNLNSNLNKYKIVEVVENIGKFIIDSFDSYFLSLEGAFFSGSVKGPSSIEYFFPSNFNEYINGTKVANITDQNSISPELISGVKGYIDEEEYKEMLKQVYYDQKVPIKFEGLNPLMFPYWSSPSITYSLNLLGLTKLRKITK